MLRTSFHRAAAARRGRAPSASILLSAALSLPACLGACSASGVALPKLAPEMNASLDPSQGRILAGDTVRVRFAGESEKNFDQDVLVRPGGEASFLLVGELKVAGMTPRQLEKALTAAYQSQLPSPELSVNLLMASQDQVDVSLRKVYVYGEVREPRAIPFVGERLTLPQAFALAGGLDKTSARLDNVLVVRWMPEEGQYHAWKIDARQKYWGHSEQPLLQAQDVVFVPNTTIDKVDIWIDKYIRQVIPVPYLIPPVQ